MSGVRLTLVSRTASPVLRDLVRGIAANLGLTFHERLSLGEDPCDVLCEIVVVTAERISEELLKAIRAASTFPGVWHVVVVPDLSTSTAIGAAESGVLLCLEPSQATALLPHLVRNIFRGLERNLAQMPERLMISDTTFFSTKDHLLASRSHETYLSPIPGRILQRLALHPNKVVPHDELMEAGWGTRTGVTEHALHVRMHCLRETLSEFGLERNLRCIRGRGYMLIIA